MSDASILSPKGFRAAGVACGLKSVAGKKDLAILVADQAAGAAAVFTTNQVAAAPVLLSRETIKRGRPRAVVVNSGNANCCTGEQGLADAREMVRLAAEAVGAQPDEMLVCSTGKIGEPMPMDKVAAGIRDAAQALRSDAQAAADFAAAIMTTDTVTKTCCLTDRIGKADVTVAGACKGSGMIAPNMATMLAFVTTDALVAPGDLREFLREAAGQTFNRITVDGDSSTNDSVIALAGGRSGVNVTPDGPGAAEFRQALLAVMDSLALQIVRDGEGATKVIEVIVEGAADADSAHRVARAVAESQLVKCAVYGCDPNWGRIVCAIGYSGAAVQPHTTTVHIGPVCVFHNGMPTGADARAPMHADTVAVRINLGIGFGRGRVRSCDLTREYVRINAEYPT